MEAATLAAYLSRARLARLALARHGSALRLAPALDAGAAQLSNDIFECKRLRSHRRKSSLDFCLRPHDAEKA